MSSARLIWATPEADKLIGYIARVSNPANQDNENVDGLIRYMLRNDHWSPFEMVSACVEIKTSRTMARQILRHRSFSFQEFSQRYAEVENPCSLLVETRLQDTSNRQNSLPSDDEELATTWRAYQEAVASEAELAYKWALRNGIAKEQARAVLPEGLTPSTMYMSGTLRSWLHYLRVRSGNGTQKEHVEVCNVIKAELVKAFPKTLEIVDSL